MPATIILNGYRNIQLRIIPVGDIPAAPGVGLFDVICSGEATADTGHAKTEEVTLRTDSAMFTDAQREKLTAIFRRARRAWKASALNEDAE